MSKPSVNVTRYKALALLIGFVCIIGFIATIKSDAISIVVKIIICMALFIGIWVSQLWISNKMNSMPCPKCNKPILLKTGWLDQNGVFTTPYKKCHFCGHEFK